MTENISSIDTQHFDLLMKSFRVALTNIRMYPITSTLVEKPLTDLYSAIKELFSISPNVTISEIDDKILLNSDEYHGKDAGSISNIKYLTQFFVQAGIKSITFKSELTMEELKDILVALSTKKPKTTTKEVVKQIIQEKSIHNVAIDEVEFISVMKSDQNVKNILSAISKPVNNLTDLMSILAQSYSELDKISEKEVKQQVQNNIAKYVSSLDPQIIRDLFSQPLPQKIEDTGLKQQVFNNLTKQKIEETFNEILTWCKNLRRETENENEFLDRLSHLKDFIKLIVNSPVSKMIPIEIFEELFKIGLVDVLPEWVKDRETKKSFITEIDELLNTNEPVKLLQESFITSLQDNLDKLCSIGLDDKIEKITMMMSENLQNPVVKLRQLASSSLNTITKQLVKHNKTKIAIKLVGGIMNLLLKERDENISKQYIEIITDSFVSMITTKEYQSFVNYGQQILRFAIEVYPTNPNKSKAIYNLLTRVFNSTKEILTSDLVEENEDYKPAILWFLNYLADTATEVLISALSKTDNVHLKKTILQILKSQQETAVETIKEFLIPKTPVRELNRIIEVLDEFNYDFSDVLSGLFNFTTYANKISIINYIYKRPTEININWLTSLLDAEDLQISEYIVDIITSLEIKSATPKLIKLLNTKNLDLKKRVIVALGVLKHVESVKPLKKILLSAPSVFSKGEPLEIRLVACWSLGNFITLPEIKTLFTKLLNSKEQAIADSVKELLGVK